MLSSLAPAGCVLLEQPLEPSDDAHAAGRRLAERALADLGCGGQLAYDGSRPVVAGAHASVSIAHTRTRVVAIAGAMPRLGIDLVDDSDEPRIARMAPRYFVGGDAPIVRFAATEAALKALGLSLLESGLFDRTCPVRVSLAPPHIEVDGTIDLALAVGRVGASTVAIAYG